MLGNSNSYVLEKIEILLLKIIVFVNMKMLVLYFYSIY